MSVPNEASPRRFPLGIAAALLLVIASGAPVPVGGEAMAPAMLSAKVLRHFPAADAFQGVAVGRHSFYAVASRGITRYDKETGTERARWSGRDGAIVHLNSCAVTGGLLVCAASNYPEIPAESALELFDPTTLARLGTQDLGHTAGWLTWADRHDGAWWLCLASYGAKAGDTVVAEYDDAWRRRTVWRLPDSALAALAPMSASGGAWGDDGLLYVMGHDRPDLLALRLPGAGEALRHVATIHVGGRGQAFGWDPAGTRLLYSIDRSRREVVVSKVPAVPER